MNVFVISSYVIAAIAMTGLLFGMGMHSPDANLKHPWVVFKLCLTGLLWPLALSFFLIVVLVKSAFRIGDDIGASLFDKENQ